MSQYFQFWGTRSRDGAEVPLLLERIVYRAVADFLADPPPSPGTKRKKAMIYWRRREDDRRWAFWWLFTNEDTEPSFRTICEVKGYNVEEVRDRLLLFRMAKPIESTDTPFKHRKWAKVVSLDRT